MKSRIFSSVATLSSLLLASAATAAVTMVPADVKTIFVPQGYDTNDQVELVLHGYLPNGCYKSGPVSVNVDHGAPGESGVISLAPQWAYHDFQFCNEILVEYKEVVNVGYLEAKDYTVSLASGSETSLFNVEEAKTDSQDNHVYLPVDGMVLKADPQGQRLVLTGTFPAQDDSCLAAERHEVYRSPSNVLVVLPIAKIVPCPQGQHQTAFSYDVVLTGDLQVKQNNLVHVRALNGKSLNKVFDKFVVLF